ncbi:MAG TPA: mechanosensitive ion channel domain-containing protein, partial [Pyrinomonadaceae bacterium]|nr:mechanosensitive ion channel domain-containing protein [Pyrinomonadaceae bacterium]
MNFWQSVQQSSGMQGYYFWVVLGFLLAAFALFAFVPAERMRVRGSVILFAVSFLGMLASGVLQSYGASDNRVTALDSAYRWVKWLSLFIEAVAVINLASVFLFDVLLDKVRLKPPRIMRDLLIAFTYIVAAITLLSQSGVDLTGIVATSAVITAVIGFSLQDTLGNIMGGMALQMERTIGVGDWVRIDQQEGRVKEIRWRQTSIETRNWDTV